MKTMTPKLCAMIATFALFLAPAAQALTIDELVGTWNMSYDMGQGTQTGTITVSKNDDGSAAITLNTQGGGSSDASDIVIEGDVLTFSRNISAQGQSIGVDYTAELVDGQLQGTFELDLGGFGGGGGPTSWTATKQ